jgi:nucleoporin ASM4
MASRINGAQQPRRDLFGTVFQPNADIFTNDTPKTSRFHQLKTDSADRSADDISINSPSRRTPAHKQHSEASVDSSNPSLAMINQKTNSTTTSNPPLWFNNPKRRTIPSNVVKRDSESTTDSSTFLSKPKPTTDSSSSGFKTLTFGTRRNHSELAHVNALSDELPPTRTISDLQRDDNPESYLSFHPDNTIGNVTTTPGNQNKEIGSLNGSSSGNILPDNLFRSPQKGLFPSTPSKTSGLFPPSQPTQQQESNLQQQQQQQQQQQNHKISAESAVLVFGYPESIANNVIKHFAKFGTILEDFESTRINPIFHTTRQKKIYPIYTGNGWVKLTYDNKASTIRALEENGSVFFGSIIGCVPYSKEAVEKIASVSINDLQDIGESEFLSNSPLNKGDGADDGENSPDFLKFNPNKISTRLSLKTDDKIFIKAKDLRKTLYSNKLSENSNSTNNNSILSKVNNWLFGWEDL